MIQTLIVIVVLYWAGAVAHGATQYRYVMAKREKFAEEYGEYPHPWAVAGVLAERGLRWPLLAGLMFWQAIRHLFILEDDPEAT